MNQQFGRYVCIHRTSQRLLDHASARTFALYPEMTSFSFSWQFFNWIPTSFSLVSTLVRAERVALYIRPCFSSCLDYVHVPYSKKRSQLDFTSKHRENKPPTPISGSRSTIGIIYFPSALPCCCTVSKPNLRDQFPVLPQNVNFC